MSSFTEQTKAINLELACTGCGALLKFKPGTKHLACEYCGAQNEIVQPDADGNIEEISLDDFLANNFDKEEKIEISTVKCDGCHAIVTFDAKTSSDKCPFCSSPLVVKSGTTSQVHKPQYLLPFGIDDKKARESFKKWIDSLWFAPNDLKDYANDASRLSGIYLPFWTFDCNTQTTFTGQRGDYYYVTETYTAVENGKNVTRTRQARRTRWSSASGKVSNAFDDLLIEASTSLNKDKLRSLEPWDLKNLTTYNDKFLSGFRTETYQVDVKSGYQQAKQRMERMIDSTIRQKIGGDEKQIHYTSTTYNNPSFKHILLPVWVSAYKYNNKVFQFLINARTGEVQGQRPYSAVKITLAVIGGLIVLALLALVLQK